ncbi:MAG: hypothetical protein SAK29_12180, partial [Scytonema sp. PMC 1069.18]|nr:hypothetical protein [Scytonema sp. PMC 1069.18]
DCGIWFSESVYLIVSIWSEATTVSLFFISNIQNTLHLRLMRATPSLTYLIDKETLNFQG